MLNIRILGRFCVLLSLSWSLWAMEMEPEFTFEQINQKLDDTIKFIQTSNLSPSQLRDLGRKFKSLGRALDVNKDEIVSNKQLNYKKPVNVPSNVKSIYTNDNGAQFFVSPVKSNENKENITPNLKRPFKLNFDEIAVNKKLKADLKREETNFVIYIHSWFYDDYLELYIPKDRRIDVKEEWEKLRQKNPRSKYQMLRKKLMLVTEKNFRQILKEYPDMIKVVEYVGESKNFDARAQGHKGDLRNDEKCLRSTKSKNEKTGLDIGLNLRDNWVIKNLASKEELKLFEALMAQIFPVQLFGASARIGDKKAFAELDEYLSWPERIKELKKAGLLTTVEDLKEELFKSKFSDSWFANSSEES